MVIAGTLPPIRGLCLFPAQLLAGMCAAGLVSCMYPGDITYTNTTLSPGTSIAQGVFIEMFMTAELVFVVLMLAAEKSKDTFIAPIGIGLALFVAMMGGEWSKERALRARLLMTSRCLLHWRISKPHAQLWPCCGRHTIPRLPLDILGWAMPWCCDRCWVLQVCQVLPLRTGEPGPGFGRGRLSTARCA